MKFLIELHVVHHHWGSIDDIFLPYSVNDEVKKSYLRQDGLAEDAGRTR
jgi:hypothetical protein